MLSMGCRKGRQTPCVKEKGSGGWGLEPALCAVGHRLGGQGGERLVAGEAAAVGF